MSSESSTILNQSLNIDCFNVFFPIKFNEYCETWKLKEDYPYKVIHLNNFVTSRAPDITLYKHHNLSKNPYSQTSPKKG